MERLDFLNERAKKEHHAVQTFDDVEESMKQYYYLTGGESGDKSLEPLPPEPKLSDFYTPSPDQQKREIIFVVLGMAVTGFIAYKKVVKYLHNKTWKKYTTAPKEFGEARQQ